MTGDPDLDQACTDLAHEAARYRQLLGLVARIDPIKDYDTIVMRRAELADAEEGFRVRGERLQLHRDRRLAGRALITVVEEVARFRRSHRNRVPTVQQLTRIMTDNVDRAETDRVQAEAEFNLAHLDKVLATHRAAAASAVVTYMKASR